MKNRIALAAAAAVLPLVAISPANAAPSHAVPVQRIWTVQHETAQLQVGPICATERHHRRVYHYGGTIAFTGQWSKWRIISFGCAS